jgi:hypothetical protein
MELRPSCFGGIGRARDCGRSAHAPRHCPIAGLEASMQIFIFLAVVIVVVAIAFGMKTTFFAAPVTITTSNTLSPHEMHLGYKNMKELPVLEVKDPF